MMDIQQFRRGIRTALVILEDAMRAKQMNKALNDLSEGRNASTSTAELLVSLHQQERLDGVIGDAYMYAAFEYAYIGDKRKVQQYAALSVEHMIVWRGTFHQYYQAMIRLMLAPEKEKSWKYFEKVKRVSPLVSG